MATAAAPEASPAVGKAGKLSDELASIRSRLAIGAMSLRDVMVTLQGRGYLFLVMLLTLPFCTPIPLPGLSTPFGIVIALIGARLALGQVPWLPARLLDTRLPAGFFGKVFAATERLLRGIEVFLRPRMLWLTQTAALRQLHAVPIFLAALMLLLPLPIPLSNLLPAFAILLLSGGLLERDGAFILAGYAAAILAAAFFGLIGVTGTHVFEAIRGWLAAR